MAWQIEENNVQVAINKLCTITGHKDPVRGLFKQLFSNAIKFNEHATLQILVEYEKKALHAVDNTSILTREYYCITVRDNVIGIAATDTERIFNMFKTVESHKRYKGAGTGLAIAKKIMAAHDGFYRG